MKKKEKGAKENVPIQLRLLTARGRNGGGGVNHERAGREVNIEWNERKRVLLFTFRPTSGGPSNEGKKEKEGQKGQVSLARNWEHVDTRASSPGCTTSMGKSQEEGETARKR